MVPQHSSATPEHYTPPEYIEAARSVMGGIDLDPATTRSVNEWSVKATHFFMKEDDGLSKEWFGRVWLNPPGGLTPDRRSLAAAWWSKLVDEYLSGRVEQAIFLGFTLEILKSTQDCAVWPGEMPFCIPKARIDFFREIEPGAFKKGGSPAHANVIVYLPPNGSREELEAAVRRFEGQFSKFGKVRT